jgi:peptidoglycan-associated lipoprotein
MKAWGKLVIVFGAVALMASGCARYRTPLATGTSATPQGKGNEILNPQTQDQAGIPLPGAFALTPETANWTQLPKIYFDYDRAVIRESERGKMEQIAEYLKAHPQEKMIIAGHCDERGTAEYNRALGERRASAAREYLVRLGINAERMTTISYGKDKPAETGHDNVSRSKNRRDEFGVGTAQPGSVGMMAP